jgi:uncharacterized membrane protein YphA (DoxX/SURF4 family)
MMTRPWGESVGGNEAAGGDRSAPGPPGMQNAAAAFVRTLWTGEGRAEVLERYGTLLARLLLSQIFLISGVMKILDWSGTEAKMAERGMFLIPLFHVAALLIELAAGLSLL